MPEREEGLVLHGGILWKGQIHVLGWPELQPLMLNVPPWTQCWCDRCSSMARLPPEQHSWFLVPFLMAKEEASPSPK